MDWTTKSVPNAQRAPRSLRRRHKLHTALDKL